MKKPKITISSELDVLLDALIQSAICGFYLAISVIIAGIAAMSVTDHTSLWLQIPLFFVGVCLWFTVKNFIKAHWLIQKA